MKQLRIFLFVIAGAAALCILSYALLDLWAARYSYTYKYRHALQDERAQADLLLGATHIDRLKEQTDIGRWRWRVVWVRNAAQTVRAESIALYERRDAPRRLLVLWLVGEQPMRLLYAVHADDTQPTRDEALVDAFAQMSPQSTLSDWKRLLRSKGFKPSFQHGCLLFDGTGWLERRRLDKGVPLQPAEPAYFYVNAASHDSSNRLLDGILRFYCETDAAGNILQRGLFSLSEETHPL